jgi:hypothetical protein
MSQTRSYTKAASILRQLHDALFAQNDSLQIFFDDNMQYFETRDAELEARCKSQLDRIFNEMIHLRRWQRRLMQRIQRFDGMKEGVS